MENASHNAYTNQSQRYANHKNSKVYAEDNIGQSATRGQLPLVSEPLMES